MVTLLKDKGKSAMTVSKSDCDKKVQAILDESNSVGNYYIYVFNFDPLLTS